MERKSKVLRDALISLRPFLAGAIMIKRQMSAGSCLAKRI